MNNSLRTKITTLALVCFTTSMVTSVAQAGILNFQGQILEETCNVTAGDDTVRFGGTFTFSNVGIDSFSSLHDEVATRNTPISVSGCTGLYNSGKSVVIYFDGVTAGSVTPEGYITNGDSTGATNIGWSIRDGNNQQLKVGDATFIGKTYPLDASGNAVLDYYTSYVALTDPAVDPIIPGKVKSTVTWILVHE